MKVVFLYHYQYKSLERDSRVLKVAVSLLKAGHQVKIIYGGRRITKPTSVQAYGTTVPCLAAWKVSKPRIWFWSWPFLTLLKKFGLNTLQDLGITHVPAGIRLHPDVIHAHDFPTLLSGYVLKKKTGAKLIYDSHELASESTFMDNLNKISRKNALKIERTLVKHCDEIITVNDSIARLMEERLNVKDINVIKNFPVLDKDPNAIKKDIRTKVDLNDKSRIALYLGGIKKGRGLEALVKAAKKMPEVQFVFMGFRDPADTLDLNSKNIHVLPHVPPDEVIAWASSADIGLSPIEKRNISYYYSLPNKVGEYIMAGLPIAVSDFPEMRKIAIEDDLGVTFNPEDPKDIEKSIRALLQPETYSKKKENVMSKRALYSWENEEKKLLTIYIHLEVKR